MYSRELANEARRRQIDVQQSAEALRAASQQLRRRFAGTMTWKPRSGREYLYRRVAGIDKALGPRSAETEAIYSAFVAGKARTEEREAGLRQTLEGMARVNRAMGLARVPRLIARILRRLDDAGALDEQLCVAGTNALFAYEAHTGLRFDSGLLATNDIDVALDARRNLRLAARSMPSGLLGLLRKIDPSFEPLAAGSFRAVNAYGLMVDLITAEPRDRTAIANPRKRRIGGAPAMEDIQAVEVPRLEMIVDAPRFGAMAIAEDGLPVWMTVPDPRWWAAHKLWLASEPTRDPAKRQRDRDQGRAVAQMLAQFWGNADLSDEALASIPYAMRVELRAAVAESAGTEAVEW